MDLGLTGRVAIVTGAAKGIGRAIAERLSTEGACVVVADVDVAAGTDVAERLGPRATFVRTDVSDADDVRSVVEQACDRFGGLHVMVNNAGISGTSRRLMADDLRDFQRVLAVDLYGVMVGTREAARAMGDGGSVVNITSIAGISPGVGFSTYRAAKAGVIHFSRCAAIELAELGVRVNVIAPGNIATDINASFDTSSVVRRIQPLQRLGAASDIADVAAFLAGDRSAQVTGTVVPVDGGTTAGPPPIDHADVLVQDAGGRSRTGEEEPRHD